MPCANRCRIENTEKFLSSARLLTQNECCDAGHVRRRHALPRHRRVLAAQIKLVKWFRGSDGWEDEVMFVRLSSVSQLR